MINQTEIISHRAYYPGYIDNSLPSIKKVVERRILPDFIEFDVQATLDHELVVLHSYGLDKLTKGSGLVRERTFNEIRKLFLIHKNGLLSDCVIPSLSEAVQILKGSGIGVKFDMKCEYDEHILSSIQKCISDFGGDVIVHAEDMNFLRNFVKDFEGPSPKVRTSFGGWTVILNTSDFFKDTYDCNFVDDFNNYPFGIDNKEAFDKVIEEAIPSVVDLKVDIISMPIRFIFSHELTKFFIDKAHAVGLETEVWAVNDKDRFDMCIRSGIDQITTDHLSLMDKYFKKV